MSFYATIGGTIEYEKREDFETAVRILRDSSWIDKDGFFLDECRERIAELSCVAECAITIPIFHYRNLSRCLEQLFVGGKGRVIWASTDGCFEAGILDDGQETTYDLEKWAKENMEEIATAPQDHQDHDVWQNYFDWQSEVEQAFFEANL